MSCVIAAMPAWDPMFDTWIVVIGILAAASCSMLGCFLLLRGMSMMGDAISHAVLPGIAIGFLISSSVEQSLPWIFAGACVAGLMTAFFTQTVHRFGRVEQGAAMGVVFTTMFAIGLILIRRTADNVDLDPGCVLYGAIELAPMDVVFAVAGIDIPRAAIVLGVVFLINAIIVVTLYKELKVAAFDPDLATALGFNADALHYLLMVLVAVTTVAAFEAVGSILVLSLLIVPPAAAHLLTERLVPMLITSIIVGGIAVMLGHLGAIVVPPWLGFEGENTQTSGMIGVATGVVFTIALLASPRHGLISRAAGRLRLRLRILGEDALGLLYRLEESGEPARGDLIRTRLGALPGASAIAVSWSLRGLRSAGRIVEDASGIHLTERGRRRARAIVRSHRLWEAYLVKDLNYRADTVHERAMALEHITDGTMQERLASEMGEPEIDPHGSRIPSPPERGPDLTDAGDTAPGRSR